MFFPPQPKWYSIGGRNETARLKMVVYRWRWQWPTRLCTHCKKKSGRTSGYNRKAPVLPYIAGSQSSGQKSGNNRKFILNLEEYPNISGSSSMVILTIMERLPVIAGILSTGLRSSYIRKYRGFPVIAGSSSSYDYPGWKSSLIWK